MFQVLDQTSSHKMTKKVQEVFRKIGIGLVENTELDLDTAMTFTYGLVSDTVDILQLKEK